MIHLSILMLYKLFICLLNFLPYLFTSLLTYFLVLALVSCVCFVLCFMLTGEYLLLLCSV